MDNTPSGYDVEVWNYLPEDIKEELIRDPRKNKLSIDCKTATQSFLSFSAKITSDSLIRDESFPPSFKSIDGRNSDSSGANVIVPECACNLEMKLSRVSRAGKNQGRYYYACASKKCQAYMWGDHISHPVPSSNIGWMHFHVEHGWKFVKSDGYKADDIIQGGVGDCWFLSAVAVLCDRADLMDKIVIDNSLSNSQLQRFRFFLGGEWRVFAVDCFLPVKKSIQSSTKKRAGTGVAGYQNLLYSRSKHSQLWVPLLEKAYAKAYGCYSAISGGHIPEALFDLTGCPCEAIHLNSHDFRSESTWEKLLRYRSIGFPMGCSTDLSGEGIVGNHAYSILDVQEIWGVTPGEQLTIKNFFSSCDKDCFDDALRPETEFGATAGASSAEQECIDEIQSTGRLRLLLIRNPWGQVGWRGSFSSRSSLWTSRLREALRVPNEVVNNGTFWMTYHDFLRRYSTVDVCKSYPSAKWKVYTARDTLGVDSRGGIVTDCSFTITVRSDMSHVRSVANEGRNIPVKSSLYLSLLQDSKRGGTPVWSSGNLTRSYWYADLSFILRRKQPLFSSVSTASGSPTDTSKEVICACFTSPMRNSLPVELTLQDGEYTLTVYRFAPLTDTSRLQHYYVHLYSPDSITISKTVNNASSNKTFVCPTVDQKRQRTQHYAPVPTFPAEKNLISYLINDALNCDLIRIDGDGGCSSAMRSDCEISSSTAMHSLLSSLVSSMLEMTIYLLCGNGVNILFCGTSVPRNDCTKVLPVLSIRDSKVIDLTSDDDENCASMADSKEVDATTRMHAKLQASQQNRNLAPCTYGGILDSTSVIILTCVLESGVRVISPFKIPPNDDEGARKGAPHGIVRLAFTLPSVPCTRVLAIVIDGQQSDGFELDRKKYVQHVFADSMPHLACSAELLKAHFDINRIEQFIHDEKNVVYPSCFRLFNFVS